MGNVAPPQDLAVRQRTWGSRFRHELSRPITITARSGGDAVDRRREESSERALVWHEGV
jgi:hypothetical protein